LVGSFQLHRTGHWMLWPATVTVILHDTIDTTTIKKNEVKQLSDRVRSMISEPVEARLKESTANSER
ncbi:MAG: hypothetical protein ABLT11_00240, partial [Candidatus Acidiferrum sp.]